MFVQRPSPEKCWREEHFNRYQDTQVRQTDIHDSDYFFCLHPPITVKLVPRLPSLQCSRTIHNFKAHFLSVLVSTAASFPNSLWDCLLPQTEITLNLLQQSNATPTVSAYAHLCGLFDYNKMPLDPMGCEVQVHKKTDKRGTWAYHCIDGWYLFISPEHYCVHNFHIKATKAERLRDVHFCHKKHHIPISLAAGQTHERIG